MAKEGQEVTVRQTDFSMVQNMGKVFYESGMFPDIRSAAQAIVKIKAGEELGFSPIYSMTKIYIVKGKVSVSAEALGALVKRSGRYDYKVKELSDTLCSLEFYDDEVQVYLSCFTIEDAKRADLMQPGSGWYKWPRAMLMSKALSQGARIVCPHIIAGVYTPEDFGMATDDEGNVVEQPTTKVIIEKPASQGKPEEIEDIFPEPASVPSAASQESMQTVGMKPRRDPANIKTTMMLARACFQDFGLQPDALFKELNITSWQGLTIAPADAYKQISSVR